VIQQKPEIDQFGNPTGRLAGYLQPNHLAFAAAEVMIGVMWALPRKPTVKLPYLGRVSLKWPLIGSFAISFYAMYASESRTAWLAVAPAMLIAYFTAPHPPGKRMKVVVYSVLILLLTSPVVVPAVSTYLDRDSSSSNITSLTGRTDFWPLAVNLIKERPIIGWGVNVIQTPIGVEFQEVTAGANQAHNALLEAALQAGIIGAAAFAISIIAMLVGSFRLPRADDYRPLIIAGTILTLIFTITESNPAWFGDMFIVYVMCLAMYGERLPGRIDLRQPVQRSRRRLVPT
jgi:O-antigen ligase